MCGQKLREHIGSVENDETGCNSTSYTLFRVIYTPVLLNGGIHYEYARQGREPLRAQERRAAREPHYWRLPMRGKKGGIGSRQKR